MTFAYKKESDSGAPSFASNAPGTVIAIFDWFLVTNLGWAKPFSGTNIAVYQQAEAPFHYLRVDDTGITDARVRLYETMSNADTGTNPTPTDAQSSGGLFFRKWSSGAGQYRIVGNGSTFIFIAQWTSMSQWVGMIFGNYVSLVPGDTKNTCIIAEPSSLTSGETHAGHINRSLSTSAISGHFFSSSINGISGSRTASKVHDGKSSQSYMGGSYAPAYPDPATNKLRISPVWLVDPVERVCRGYIPGFWHIGHTTPFASLDTFTGASGIGAGRSFEAITTHAGSMQLLIETSDTWGGLNDLL